MQILVTGGAGFIGNNLILKLCAEGHRVVSVDNVNDYYDPALKKARLKRFGNTVDVYNVDITDREALEVVFSKYDFDKVCHLAAQAGVRYSLEYPEVYIDTNYQGSFNVLDLAKKYAVSHVLFASTSSVYGESKDMPFTENNCADRPMSIYAATKRGMEMLGASYNHLYGMDVTCLRFFTVYGPWGRPDMALFKFTKNILENTPIDVYNNGKMSRDFTYIDDIVEGFRLALHKPSGYKTFNLGQGNPVNLMYFIQTLEKTLGRKAVINNLPIQLGDVPETYANVEKARKDLGFKAKTTVEEGVPKFVDWYKEYYGVR